jgi:hypothetical protein
MKIDKNTVSAVKESYEGGIEDVYDDTIDGQLECINDIALRFDLTNRQVEQIVGF